MKRLSMWMGSSSNSVCYLLKSFIGTAHWTGVEVGISKRPTEKTTITPDSLTHTKPSSVALLTGPTWHWEKLLD
jgi:hypothetical protein